MSELLLQAPEGQKIFTRMGLTGIQKKEHEAFIHVFALSAQALVPPARSKVR